jgi:hypothetical protein
MADNNTVFLSPEIYAALLVAFAVPVVMTVVGYLKRQGAVDTKTTVTNVNLGGLGKDVTDLKDELRDFGKELQKVRETMHDIEANKERIGRIEIRLDKDLIGMSRFEDALRIVHDHSVRMSNLEDKISSDMIDRRKGRGPINTE